LRIDDDTLNARDQQPIPTTTSWLEAEPILISPRLRKTGQQHRSGRPTNVIDRSAGKKQLAALMEQEAKQIERARHRLATSQPMRLSELGPLNSCEFQLFLDLLGKALAEQKTAHAEVITTSSDGSLQIVLKPTADGRLATINTSDGDFHGRDYFVCICDLLEGEPTLRDNQVQSNDMSVTDEDYQIAEHGHD
jgi:uncharacterized protein (TIGR02677 family)